MAETPTSSLAKSYDYLRHALAASSTWQAWTNSDDEDEALSRIYYRAVPENLLPGDWTADQLAALRPFALIILDPNEGYLRRVSAVGSAFEFDEAASMVLHVAENYPSRLDAADAEIWFLNKIGGVLDDLCGGIAGDSTSTGRLAISSVRMPLGPERTAEEDLQQFGDAFMVDLLIGWSN